MYHSLPATPLWMNKWVSGGCVTTVQGLLTSQHNPTSLHYPWAVATPCTWYRPHAYVTDPWRSTSLAQWTRPGRDANRPPLLIPPPRDVSHWRHLCDGAVTVPNTWLYSRTNPALFTTFFCFAYNNSCISDRYSISEGFVFILRLDNTIVKDMFIVVSNINILFS